MIDFINLNLLEIPEGKVIKVVKKSSGKVLWEKTYTNYVTTSINSDGSIYNSKGYKDGYRVRSGGAEASVSNTSCTGFIKVNAGDIIRISGCEFSTSSNSNAINVSDINFTNIGQFTMLPVRYGIFQQSAYASYGYKSVIEEKEGVWKWVVPPAASGVAYIRVTGYDITNGPPGAKMLITINEEIL